jgi:hypothetical protein
MNFESLPQSNNEPNKESGYENGPNIEVTEVSLTPEDLIQLENLRDKIQQIEISSFQKQQKFVEATEDFLNKLYEVYKEDELVKFAAVSFLKGEDIAEATDFDLDGEYSVMGFVETFDK